MFKHEKIESIRLGRYKETFRATGHFVYFSTEQGAIESACQICQRFGIVLAITFDKSKLKGI